MADPARSRAGADLSGLALSVGILLWPSFPLMSLAGLVETLRHAGDHGDDSSPRYAGWEIIGAPASATRSSCGIAVAATAGYVAPRSFDHLFVIGGLLRDIDTAPPRHREYLHAALRAGVPVVAVCTGSFVLARERMLDGLPVCIHPYHQRHFEAEFPGHRIVTDRDFEVAGQVTTVLGGVSIMALMRRIIGAHMGPDRAAKVDHQMTLPSRDAPRVPLGPDAPGTREILDSRIQRALVILDAESTQAPSIAEIARSLGLSERHFLRLFHAQVGCSPKAYLLDNKLSAAVWMLRNTARSITSIAYAAGFASGASLADHCRKRLGATPSGIRSLARAARGEAVAPPDTRPPAPWP